MGFLYLTQPKLGELPPVPEASSEAESSATTTKSAAIVDEEVTETPAETVGVEEAAEPVLNQTDEATAPQQDIIVIEVAGSLNGTIEVLLNADVAPEHTARIKTLAAAGAYDDVVFHRVIDGFMAQTGDVQFGKRDGGQIKRAGTGSSDSPNLAAEFSDQKFEKGVVGMARSSDPNSANSQFFIMFDAAPYLNGQYTIIGRVVAGQDVVDAIKKGDPNLNGVVVEPDYMKSVRVK